ncbi:MAG: AAA family ATPase [Verrucomicrobia bacterium]|nr:AAA family ATPase [Verrucomicrobiota bacterium]
MIERIVIENFKSFKKVDLRLGRLNLFIGTNASGKSNFFDALRVLQGIGNGFSIHEILDGKPKSATSEVWEPIRGGSTRATFSPGGEDQVTLFEVEGRFDAAPRTAWNYRIGFLAREGRLCLERLLAGTEIYDSSPISNNPLDPVFEVRYYGGKKGRQPHLKFEKARPVLAQMARGGNGKWTKGHSDFAARLAYALANMQRIDPSPTILRGYSLAHQIQRMGERGENFAALVRTICADSTAKAAFVSWLKEHRPAEVDDVDTLSGAVGEPLFMLQEGGREFPAPVLSDGTLRFAAITAAFFQPDLPEILTIEEIENAVHASRIRLLVELLRSQASQAKAQIMATTHSPIVLAWLKPDEYAATFFCKRDEQTGESQVSALTEIPRFREIVQKQPISDLFAEGWMETAL